MHISRLYLVICLSLLSLQSCKVNENEKVHRFLNYIKNEEYDKAKGLIWKGDGKGFDNEGTDFYLKQAHNYITDYGIPPESKWDIKYDTGAEKSIFRIIEITIPFTNTGEVNEPLQRTILLRYIYKMPFYGDSIFTFQCRKIMIR